jgi:hypothetical protein
MINFDFGSVVGDSAPLSVSDSMPLLYRLCKRRRTVSPTICSNKMFPNQADILPEPAPNFPDTEPIEDTNRVSTNPCPYQRSFVVEYDRNNLDNKHIIIPFDELVKFIDSNFVCKFCGHSKSTYQQHTLGIATSLNWFCCC